MAEMDLFFFLVPHGLGSWGAWGWILEALRAVLGGSAGGSWGAWGWAASAPWRPAPGAAAPWRWRRPQRRRQRPTQPRPRPLTPPGGGWDRVGGRDGWESGPRGPGPEPSQNERHSNNYTTKLPNNQTTKTSTASVAILAQAANCSSHPYAQAILLATHGPRILLEFH